MKSFEDRDVGGHAHREGGHQDVPADQPGELEARQENRIEIHDNLAAGIQVRTSGYHIPGRSDGVAIRRAIYRPHQKQRAMVLRIGVRRDNAAALNLAGREAGESRVLTGGAIA